MGFVLSGMNFGALVGPFVAGALYEKVGYYSVFAAVIALLVFDTVLRLIIIEKRIAAQWLEEIKISDPILNQEAQIPQDAIIENPKVQAITFNSHVTPEAHPKSDETSPLLPFLRTLEHPSSPKKPWLARAFPAMNVLLRSRRLMTAVYGCFTHTTLIAAFDAILPLFVKRTFGWGSAGAGSIFLAITVPSLLGPAVGALSDRYGTKRVALLGFAIAGPFLALLALVVGQGPAYQVLLVGLLVCTSRSLLPL